METQPPSGSPRQPKMPYLPAEIRLKILKEMLKLPSGIHSERWPIYKKCRVDKALAVPGLMEMVPEALYKYNAVIVKASCRSTLGIQGNPPTFQVQIPYPKPAVNRWVRKLEFQPILYTPGEAVRLNEGRILYQPQAQWLRRLATGVLGFENLDVLRITFKPIIFATHDFLLHCCLSYLELDAAANGPFRFRTKKLEIVFNDHLCEGNCVPETEFCARHARIMAIMSAHQDPVPDIPESGALPNQGPQQSP